MSVRHGESKDDTSAWQTRGHAQLDSRRADLRDRESGQTTVVMTLFLATFLFGFIALGIDAASLFHAKRKAQGAADAAAVAAAEEAGQGIASEQAGAEAVAKINGFDTGLAVNPAVVTIRQVPLSGNYINASPSGTYLEVIVSQPIKTFFAGMVTHKSTMLISARAVAAPIQPPGSCVCLEGTSGPDLILSNNAHMNPNGCGTTVNSAANNAITLTGGASLGGVSIGSVSTNWNTWNGGSNINNGASIAPGTLVVPGIPAACSPAIPPPLPASEFAAGQCSPDPSTAGFYYNGSAFNIGPNSPHSIPQTFTDGTTPLVCYNSLTIGANGDTETLNPGIYIINGGSLHFQGNGNQGGQGVFFYLLGGASLTIDNGANVNLTAMNSGPYAGIVVFQDPVGDPSVPRAADNNPISIQGGSTMSMNGTIFAPTSNVNMGNGSNGTVNASLVAKTLTMVGGTTLKSNPLTGLGAVVATTAKLVE